MGKVRNPVAVFTSAQLAAAQSVLALRDARTDVQAAFTASAVAASVAVESGVTLQALVDANVAALGDLVAARETAQGTKFQPVAGLRSTVYVSVEGVAIHALTGDVLRKPLAEDGPKVVATTVQTLVTKAKRTGKGGTTAVRSAIRAADSQQDAITRINAYLSKKLREDADKRAGSTENESRLGAGKSVESQSVESLLAQALSMVRDGAEVTATVRDTLGELVDALPSVVREAA